MCLVAHDPSVLTAAVKRVLPTLTPDTLNWEGVEIGGVPSAGCFHAVWDGHVFSVNLLSGTVLYDGIPPSRLPKTIVSDEAYKRSFGTRNFEVRKPPALNPNL